MTQEQYVQQSHEEEFMSEQEPKYTTTPHVYTAINQVAMALAAQGISKHRKNQQQGYSFRGIDDMYNALAPFLAQQHLCILPRCLSREVSERQAKGGGALFSVVVSVEYDFVSAQDGSKHTVGPIYGEAMDSGDKATNKALSAAFKYCVMQSFSIPVEGQSIDSEVDTPAPISKAAQDALAQLKVVAGKGMLKLKAAWKKLDDEVRGELQGEIDALKTAALAADAEAEAEAGGGEK